MPDFATTVESLEKVTGQGTDWQRGKEENEAFEALKNRLAEASMIAFHDKQRLLTRLTSVTGIP